MILRNDSPLPLQIPEDVRRRMKKAGVDDVEWYAGRLDDGRASLSNVPQERQNQLHELRRHHRKAARHQRHAAGKHFVKAVLRTISLPGRWARGPRRQARGRWSAQRSSASS